MRNHFKEMIHLINGYANYQTAIIHENDNGLSDPDLTKDGICNANLQLIFTVGKLYV